MRKIILRVLESVIDALSMLVVSKLCSTKPMIWAILDYKRLIGIGFVFNY